MALVVLEIMGDKDMKLFKLCVALFALSSICAFALNYPNKPDPISVYPGYDEAKDIIIHGNRGNDYGKRGENGKDATPTTPATNGENGGWGRLRGGDGGNGGNG